MPKRSVFVSDGVPVVVFLVVVGVALTGSVLVRLVGIALAGGGAAVVVAGGGIVTPSDLRHEENPDGAKERDSQSLFHGSPPPALVRAVSGRSVTQYLRKGHVGFSD